MQILLFFLSKKEYCINVILHNKTEFSAHMFIFSSYVVSLYISYIQAKYIPNKSFHFSGKNTEIEKAALKKI